MQPTLISDLCPLCGSTLVFDKYDFYKCPNCGGEFWPPDDSPKEQKKQLDEAFCNQYVSLSQQENRPGKGGGNKSAKKKKKKPKPGHAANIVFNSLYKQV